MKSAIIIGGTGFVGPHMEQQLSDRYTVTATGRSVDICDAQGVLDLISRLRPDVVVNLASITTVRESFERPYEMYQIGFLGVLNLLTALKACKFSGRFLQVSSSEVYGFPSSDQLPLLETAPVRPRSPYSVAKAAAELLCYQWAQEGQFDVMVARPFTHIGPGQSTRFAVAKFVAQIAEIMAGHREPSIEVGALRTTRDFTDVRDVARAYDAILEHGQNGATYNVCSGREIGMRDVLNELIRLSGVNVAVVEKQNLIRSSEQERVCGSYAFLNAATGWEPKLLLTQTLQDTLAWAIQNRHRSEQQLIARN